MNSLNVTLLSTFMTVISVSTHAQKNKMFVPSKIVENESQTEAALKMDSIINKNDTSRVAFFQDERLNELQERYNKNHEEGLIKGYRIELYSSSGANSRMKAYEALLDFKDKYEQINGYVEWNEPNFEVEVGDYRSRLEAQKYLKEIAGDYPFAFIKKTKIKLPQLEKEGETSTEK